MIEELLITLADPKQLSTLIKGDYLHGRKDPRIALLGRSNVGKSSLINSLFIRKKIARVSKKPGKTRTIQFFIWKDGKKIIADLPGYGFAKVSKDEKASWNRLISSYIQSDPGLGLIAILLDARHAPTPVDEEAFGFLSVFQIPVVWIMTKTDQLKTQKERALRLKEVTAAAEKYGVKKEAIFWVSNFSGDGMKSLRRALGEEEKKGKVKEARESEEETEEE